MVKVKLDIADFLKTIWPFSTKRRKFIKIYRILNLYVPSAPLLYPLKTSKNRKVFWSFQGVEKRSIGNKWVKEIRSRKGFLREQSQSILRIFYFFNLVSLYRERNGIKLLLPKPKCLSCFIEERLWKSQNWVQAYPSAQCPFWQ